MKKNNKVVEFDCCTKEQKRADMKEKIASKLHDTANWIRYNKDFIILVAPIVVAGTKFIGKRINLRKEEMLKDLYVYDRSGGHYWRLRRSLSNKEWLEFDNRRKNGERVADILSDFRVLK